MVYIVENEASLYNIYESLTKTQYSFMLIRIKHMHLYNFLYGRDSISNLFDEIIKIIAKTCIRNDYIYRLYSDHVILYINTQDPYIIIHTIYQMDEQLKQSNFFPITNHVSLVIGIYFMQSNVDFNQAFDNAKFAITHSSDIQKYNTTFNFYDLENVEFEKQQFSLMSRLENAFKHNEFEIFLQPKVDVTTLQLKGAEALIRWVHNGSEVPLQSFMPIIDKNAFIRQIDLFVFEEVCKLFEKWMTQGIELIPISVNISKASYDDGFYYVKEIQKIHRSYNVEQKYIEFELSEQICFENSHQLHHFLDVLCKQGYRCSLDDFGSEYSSFLSLTYLPIHAVKLDASFCLGEWNQKREIILSHVLEILQQLHFEIVVEGVETKASVQFFSSYPNILLQGFYFNRPMCVASFEQYYMLNQHTSSKI